MLEIIAWNGLGKIAAGKWRFPLKSANRALDMEMRLVGSHADFGIHLRVPAAPPVFLVASDACSCRSRPGTVDLVLLVTVRGDLRFDFINDISAVIALDLEYGNLPSDIMKNLARFFVPA